MEVAIGQHPTSGHQTLERGGNGPRLATWEPR
jgi:hypothetical protein